MTDSYDGPERRNNFFDQGYNIIKGPTMTPQIRLKVELIITEAIKQGHRAMNTMEQGQLTKAVLEATNRIEQAFLGTGKQFLKDAERVIEGRK